MTKKKTRPRRRSSRMPKMLRPFFTPELDKATERAMKRIAEVISAEFQVPMHMLFGRPAPKKRKRK